MSSGLPASIADWALAEADGERIVGCRRTPMAGGATAARIERIDIDIVTPDDRPCTIGVVQKWTWRHEVLGLRAAQVARHGASAVPRLLADGTDERGHWLIMPFYGGTVVAKASVPGEVFESLARLHVAYSQVWTELAGIPSSTPSGGAASACPMRSGRSTVRPPATRAPRSTGPARSWSAWPTTGGSPRRWVCCPARFCTATFTGNILVSATGSTLVDWGSARIGSPMLDLANLSGIADPGFAAYATAWHQSTGERLDEALVKLGFRWAAVQIPIQYLAYLVEHRSPAEVDAALDRAEHALAMLRAG